MWLEGVIRDSLDQKRKSVWRVQLKDWNDRIILLHSYSSSIASYGYILLDGGVTHTITGTVETRIML